MSIYKYDSTQDELIPISGSTVYADAPIGSIIPYGGTTAPDGFLLCQGQAVSRTTYAELFAVIGTAFGAGDGSTTFNVPDLRNRTVMGAGSNGNLYDVQEDATAKNGLTTWSSQGEGKTGGAGTHTHEVLAYTGAKASIANVYPKTIIASNMEAYNGSYVTDADYGGTSVQYLKDAGYHSHYVGLSNGDPETRPKNIRMNWIIKATQVGMPSDFMAKVDEAIDDKVVDTVANGNMNPVTSNAVYNKIKEVTIRRDISSTTATSSMTYEQAIADMLTQAGVKDFENGIYIGGMACNGLPPHQWVGIYQMNKRYDGDYGLMVNGNANSQLFTATYALNTWVVKLYTQA